MVLASSTCCRPFGCQRLSEIKKSGVLFFLIHWYAYLPSLGRFSSTTSWDLWWGPFSFHHSPSPVQPNHQMLRLTCLGESWSTSSSIHSLMLGLDMARDRRSSVVLELFCGFRRSIPLWHSIGILIMAVYVAFTMGHAIRGNCWKKDAFSSFKHECSVERWGQLVCMAHMENDGATWCMSLLHCWILYSSLWSFHSAFFESKVQGWRVCVLHCSWADDGKA